MAKKKEINWWMVIAIVLGLFVLLQTLKPESSDEQRINGAREWLEDLYEVTSFSTGSAYLPLAGMKEKGDRATQVVSGFDALTRAYPFATVYTVTIHETGQKCIYGLTWKEWDALELTTYGTILEASEVECY